MDSPLYDYIEYYSTNYKYPSIQLSKTRSVAVDWEKTIDKIVKLSELSKDHHETNISKYVKLKKDTEVEITSEDIEIAVKRFWDLTSKCLWYDKDEILLKKENLNRFFTRDDMNFILNIMINELIPRLKERLTILLQYIDPSKHNNILSHIIMKGHIFYNSVMETPSISLYLIDQYYDVYDWLQ